MMRILTIRNYVRNICVRGEWTDCDVTAVTYMDPYGVHSAASFPGWMSQEHVLRFLAKFWKEAS